MIDVLAYFTLDELFCHRRRVGIQSVVSPSPSCWHRSSGSPSPRIISEQRLPIDFVVFPSVVFLLGGSRVLYYGELLVPSSSYSCLLVACLLAASSFLILSILVFPAAFQLSVVVNICLSLLVSVQFSLWYSRVGVNRPLWSVSWSSWWFLCAKV